MTAILDAGALIGLDRNDRRLVAMLRVIQLEQTPIRTSGAVIGQVWRSGRQANLSRFLRGVDVRAIDRDAGRRIGELLGAAQTSDVVDAHVALLAADGDQVLTSDLPDISHLLATLRTKAAVLEV